MTYKPLPLKMRILAWESALLTKIRIKCNTQILTTDMTTALLDIMTQALATAAVVAAVVAAVTLPTMSIITRWALSSAPVSAMSRSSHQKLANVTAMVQEVEKKLFKSQAPLLVWKENLRVSKTW